MRFPRILAATLSAALVTVAAAQNPTLPQPGQPAPVAAMPVPPAPVPSGAKAWLLMDYADVIVHRPFMGPVTLVGRLEHLDYDTGDPAFNDAASGLAVGTRIKLIESLYAQANVTHRPSEPYARNATATDVALTYTVRYRH